VKNPSGIEMQIKRDYQECTRCHRLDALDYANAPENLDPPHGPADGLFLGKHSVLDCVVCHSPHTGVVQLEQEDKETTRVSCEGCHTNQANNYKVEKHGQMDCVICHMPFMYKLAWEDGTRWMGDVRTHNMGIDPILQHQFSEDGMQAYSAISLDLACRQCHIAGTGVDKSDEQLSDAATDYHTSIKLPAPEEEAEDQSVEQEP
jgi:hypothetical protein